MLIKEERHKCFISFKTEDIDYKEIIQDILGDEMIDKSLNKPICSDNEEYIMRKIRMDYLGDSTVTIFLIGEHSSENSHEDQRYIKRELQASLYNNPPSNSRNGILGIVLPDMYDKVFRGKYKCRECGEVHNCVCIDDSTVIKEFSVNYYINKNHSGCSWAEDERYCVLVKLDDFIINPRVYINQAFSKRRDEVAHRVTVYP